MEPGQAVFGLEPAGALAGRLVFRRHSINVDGLGSSGSPISTRIREDIACEMGFVVAYEVNGDRFRGLHQARKTEKKQQIN